MDDRVIEEATPELCKMEVIGEGHARKERMNTILKNSLLPALIACEYVERKRICSEVWQVLEKWSTLMPCEDAYVTNNGMMLTLVGLKGTIPIKFKDNEYQIPTAIWIPKDYPKSSPIIYVLPTSDPPMRIRTSKYVDRNGEIILPIKLPIRFSLETLVKLLITIFEENPPLYVKKRRMNNAEQVSHF